METTITVAGLDRVPALARLLARTFADDAMVSWAFHDHDVPERAERLFTALIGAYAPSGAVLEAGDATGVAVWVPSDGEMSLEAMNDLTWPAIVPLTEDGGARYARFWDWIESLEPDEPHFLLDMVAVDASTRGNGIGTALIRHGLEQAAAGGVPAFLATSKPRNVGYYQRLGFHVVSDGDAPDDGPRIWCMRWDGELAG